jgi:hypothetical protein
MPTPTRRRHTPRPGRASYALALIATAISLVASPTVADDNPFPSLIGTWNGPGQVVMEDSKSEAMRCKAYYTGQPDAGMGLAIRCANASAKIDLRASLAYTAGAISGTWEERTYNAVGTATGKGTGSNVALAITGGGLDGSLNVSITPSGHTVRFANKGPGLKAVTIDLIRG